MIGFGFKLNEMKSMFFFDKEGNANPILRALDGATRQVLSRFGSFVRRTAKTSIRKRKATAGPGQPPSSHTGLLKQFIYFGYDIARQSVVVGPTRLNAESEGTPERLEYGGTTRLRTRREFKRKGRTIIKMSGATVHYGARPYMHPALAKELPGLPAMWRDSMKP